uniref:Polymerase PA n=1 Tax=Dermapteran orthomyxo-related virus OKIAV170 TaxID=2746276 RepID=A0A7D7IPM2_9ORTO|nr:polymerase PA [Dermapteran orthomyxo-related virus OKIAV170]
MANKYEKLIYDNDLYPLTFIQDYGERSPHWHNEGWRERELSLRHDFCCLLLCNLEKTNSNEQEIQNTYDRMLRNIKRRATHDLKLRPQKMKKVESDSDEDMEVNEISDQSEDEEMDDDSPFRYVLLEGLTTSAFVQNKYATKWGIPNPDRTWDIIDKKKEQFIEVKVTGNVEEAFNKFHGDPLSKDRHYILCVIDALNCEISWSREREHSAGSEKVQTLYAKKFSSM